jgi:hypothetical protein
LFRADDGIAALEWAAHRIALFVGDDGVDLNGADAGPKGRHRFRLLWRRRLSGVDDWNQSDDER